VAPQPITAVKGFRDVLPEESGRWHALELATIGVLASYGFAEIRLPIAEKTELFRRSIGAATDIVEKEMYTFVDRGDVSVTLRPEATASVVRAAVEHGLVGRDSELRLFYRGPMFRRERPQKGRFRQFYQIGAEVLGRSDPVVDAEVVMLASDIVDRVGGRGVVVEINSLGDEACRPAFRELLRAYASRRLDALCENCRRRLDHNPMRILDCKEPGCREAMDGAPQFHDHLCASCREHFASVRRLLDRTGVRISVNPRIVRGLDYYCRTAFEITAEGLGSQNAIAGGGRYDRLVEELGGPPIPGVGFALGVERLVMVADALGDATEPLALLVAPLGEAAVGDALALAARLRRTGQRVEITASERSLRSVMRHADRVGAPYVLIIGDDERVAGRGTVRDMILKIDRPHSVDLAADAGTVLAQVRGTSGGPG
jgi:histidyl-tRNA synthetase